MRILERFFKAKVKVSGECVCCGKCCRNLILVFRGEPIKDMETFERAKEIRPYYVYFSPIHKDDDGLIYFECSNLSRENKCMLHDDRPSICRDYPQESMLQHKGKLLEGCGYRIESSKAFDEFLKEQS